jgi:hypothetical protein
METYKIISISLVLLIIIYWLFLVYRKSNKNIEGFEGEIKKLIDFTKTKTFSTKVWDNYSYLSGIYNKDGNTLPTNFKECVSVSGTNNSLSNCPISIWRPNKEDGYSLIGDVMTKLFVSPNNETIKDIRIAKTPGAITDKNLDTVCVIGSELKEPNDYVYVGSFGSGVMINFLEENDKYLRLKTLIKSNFESMIKKQNQLLYGSDTININTTTGTMSQINVGHQHTMLIFAEQLYKIGKINIFDIKYTGNIFQNFFNRNYTVQAINQETIDNLNEIYTSSFKPGNDEILNFINKQKIKKLEPLNSLNIHYEIKKNKISIDRPYKFKDFFAKFSFPFINDIEKIINKTNISEKIEVTYYTFKISNLGIIPALLTPVNGRQDEVTVKYKPDLLHIIGYENGFGSDDSGHTHRKYNARKAKRTTRLDDEYYLHSKLNIIPNTQIKLNYTYRFRKAREAITTVDRIVSDSKWPFDRPDGDQNIDKKILSFHQPSESWVHPQIEKIYDMEFSVKDEIVASILSGVAEDNEVLKFYNILTDEIKIFVESYAILTDYGYRMLSIWQPIPPPGYVALGCVFLNSDKTVKPATDLISCIPQNCAKNFKRRPWLPEDLIFKYVDDKQNLSFYRNPYLGTVVVIDELRDNGIFKGQLPDKMKYTNDPKSPNWECFDIVPCIKESDYVSNLTESHTKSKRICKSYQGLENKSIDKLETNKNLRKEEDKLKKIIAEKKKYSDELMKNLSTMMSNEELYKMINTGINRHKMKTDLESQRKLHETVSDKLMRTRGFEISLDDPQKFKDILQRFIVARGIKSNSSAPKDCPVCKLPDTSDMIQLKDLKMCYGCVEDVVRELIGSKRASGEAIPRELQELENRMVKNTV